jgi:hypothetical protein
MPDTPIACTLSPDGMVARQVVIDTLAADALLERTTTEAGLQVRLRDTPQVEQRTRELIAAEARCCTFLTFDLQRVDDALVLDISAPPEARPVIDTFFAHAAA